jgi:3-methylcrotonyl-CoA carboxylase alpha subunit
VRPEEEHSGDAELTSPMPGAIVAVSVDDGAAVDAGTVVVTVEAMKMEHALTAPVDGVVELLVAVGDQVKVGQPLARIAVNTNAIPATRESEDSAS